MNLANRTAIVTGAANGIGKAIAARLADDGAAVAALDIDIERAEKTAGAIATSGGSAIAIKADVTRSSEIKNAVDKVIAQFGHIDILVNCAGGFAEFIEFKDKTEDAWKWVIDLNLNGTLICTRSVINHMIERRFGRIINIASIAAEVGIKRLVDYAAAKGAVVSLTKALAMEVGPYNVTVNSVSPGAIHSRGKGINYENTGIYLPRAGGAPEDVAAAVAFLASDDAAYITGANYTVDGGRVLGPRGS